MAISIGLGISALSAVSSYQQGKKQAAAARDAASRAATENAAAAAADRQAAEQAVKRSQVEEAAKANEEAAAAQMKETPTVTVDDGTGASNRLRKVKASFNLDSTDGAGGAGSIRV